MGVNFLKESLRATRFGDVRIRPFCTPAAIDQLDLDPGFAVDGENRSLIGGRERLKLQAGLPDANVVLAISNDDRIIGFGILAYPETGERWADLGPQIMMEVRVIEVVRQRRSAGIASGMLETMLADPRNDDKIVYMVGYSWTWDLGGSGLTAAQYRRMLVNLFNPHGFIEYQTNEPNICLRPENLFLGRIGKNITPVILNRFKWLRFGLSPWRWL
jgi:acetoin utilization protein AcuA